CKGARAAGRKPSPAEHAISDAPGKGYKGPEPLDPPSMQPYTEAYADAMKAVAKRIPGDDDVQVLAAEAAMDVNPWKLWSLDGKAAPGTDEIVSRLELVLARSPSHPGAN